MLRTCGNGKDPVGRDEGMVGTEHGESVLLRAADDIVRLCVLIRQLDRPLLTEIVLTFD